FLSFVLTLFFFFFSRRRRHTRSKRDWSSDVCSSDLYPSSLQIPGSERCKSYRRLIPRIVPVGTGDERLGTLSREHDRVLFPRVEIGRASCRDIGQVLVVDVSIREK